ncbi:phosphate/phosphite/phosphonate ABC transporter substrate-binding protein [Oceanispirochaeta crateris]|uniref:Phosphate/phosphite/phosphonate ABC transporter substrate-binding protein n=1 Tax=Oceanispirochaeta crateris TaxID=2518645 RepID=A0A5C1QN63_9SPIO|nr:phosphate/phosphite/phosphonate ABC transporter substrate-binding protein [Oceanispirochaeta crateris]QEN08778.1 phosphate/phosphite/phosphonate ABC transporter substrate-binding protein [Oceanispirochaeta crateris]
MNKCKIIMIFLSLFILLGAGQLCCQEQGSSETLKFGYSSSQNPSLLIESMTPLMEIMSEGLNVKIEFVHKKTFSEMQKAYINQEIDFGIINAFSFLRVIPYDAVIPIAARKIQNSKSYQSFFFTRKNSGIKSIDDLHGRVVALGDPYSTSSYLIPHEMFRRKNIEPETDFSETIIISKQDSLILSVLNRTSDAGVCASFIYNEQSEDIREELYVFDRSEPFALGPFVVNKNLDQETIKTIRDILLTLPETERGQRALNRAGIEGFEPVNIEDYDSLIKIAKSLNIN